MYTLSFITYAGVSWLLPPLVVFAVTLFALKLIDRLFPRDGRTRRRPDKQTRPLEHMP